MRLGIPVYEGVNLLDVAGPLEMFTWVGASHALETLIISENGEPVTSINNVRFDAHASFASAPALDVLWVPGGDPRALVREGASLDTPYLSYLRQVAQDAQWVCSVCEGALLLARAGLLDGYKAMTHWAFVECLRAFPAIEVVAGAQHRFVVSGNRLTGGGISAGLDEALKLIELLFGRAAAERAQITTEYFPAPPVSAPFPAQPPKCGLVWPDR